MVGPNSFEDDLRIEDVDEWENSETFKALRAAARGEIDVKEIGRDKKLTKDEERVADRLLKAEGRGPSVVNRAPSVPVNFKLQPETIALLEEMARGLGYWHGGKGRISMLLDAIGAGKFKIVPADHDAV